MNKNRCVICFVCIALMLFCCSCGLFGPQRYVCNIEKVDSIQIIRLDRYVEGEYRFDYTVLTPVSDCAAFVKRLNQVKHSVNWGDPRQMYEQFVVIRIEYRNGDFDLLHADAQCFNRSGVNNYGYFFFDDEDFNALIAYYLRE